MASAEEDLPLGLRQLRALAGVAVRAAGGGQYEVCAEGAEGAVLLRAREHGALVSRVLAGRACALQVHVHDTEDREVMQLSRAHSVCGEKARVSVAGAAAALLRREDSLLKLLLAVSDPAGRPLLRLKGPAAAARDAHYELFSADKQRIGAISRRSGGAGGAEGRGDGYVISFPQQMDVRHKAVVIAACFLIDFLIFDN